MIARVVSLALLTLGVACTTCYDRILQSATGEFAVAEVRERVCGTAAGMSVAILPPGIHDISGRAADFEPFRITCTCPVEVVRTATITVAWRGPRELEVRHTRGLKSVRAESAWKGFTIKYVPVYERKDERSGT